MSEKLKVEASVLLDEISNEISQLFKEHAQRAKEELTYWAQKLLELKLIKLQGNEEQIKEAEKSERYAYNALRSLYALEVNFINEQAWSFAERLLTMLKKILLSA